MSKQVYKFEQRVKELIYISKCIVKPSLQISNCLICVVKGVVKTAKSQLTHCKNRTQQVKFIYNMPSTSLHICIGDYFFNKN